MAGNKWCDTGGLRGSVIIQDGSQMYETMVKLKQSILWSRGKLNATLGLVKISGENRRGGGGEGEDSQGLIKILTQLNWEENTGKWG